jgi:hypothetical protein
MHQRHNATRNADLAGAVPQLATTQDCVAAVEPQMDTHSKQTAARSKTRLNLRRVVEVLEDEGLDPTEELVRLVKDPSALDADVRARFLNELVQYYQPKIKAVELTGKDGAPIEVTAISQEQAEAIAREYLISSKADAAD